MQMDVVFVHGWAYNAGVWNTLIPALGADITAHRIDLSYFGQPSAPPEFPSKALLIGHSLGVLWLLRHLDPSAPPCGFVSINGFDCFGRHTADRTIRTMALQLKRDPASLLDRFWANCGAPPPDRPCTPDIKALQQGLDELAHADMHNVRKDLDCPILALAATQDRIVPESMSRDIWDADQLQWCESDSHVLPLTHAPWCAARIKEFCDGLR